jgi:hypothetical protein
MKTIYVAGPFSWQQRIKQHADELIALGYEITAEWLQQSSNFTRPDNSTIERPDLPTICKILSQRDIRNIFEADTFIVFEPGTTMERVTRVAEFGGALFTGRQCIVIGPEEEDKKDVISSIFIHFSEVPEIWQRHWCRELDRLKPVLHYQNWDAFKTDITNPVKHLRCATCGIETVGEESSNCSCEGLSFVKWRTKNSDIEVYPPKDSTSNP